MDDIDRYNRIKSWREMLDILPEDSPEGRERDTYWARELESQLQELEQGAITPQLNCLAHLTQAQNALRGLKPSQNDTN